MRFLLTPFLMLVAVLLTALAQESSPLVKSTDSGALPRQKESQLKPIVRSVSRKSLENTKKRVTLGVTLKRPSTELMRHVEVPQGVGFVVTTVHENGPADQAGLEQHDIITRMDEQWLINGNQLAVLLQMKGESESVDVSLVRSGRSMVIPVTLGSENMPEPLQQSEDRPINPLPLRLADQSLRSAYMQDGKHSGTMWRSNGLLMLKIEHLVSGEIVFEGDVLDPAQVTLVPHPWSERIDTMKTYLDNYKPRRRPRIISPAKKKRTVQTK